MCLLLVCVSAFTDRMVLVLCARDTCGDNKLKLNRVNGQKHRAQSKHEVKNLKDRRKRQNDQMLGGTVGMS